MQFAIRECAEQSVRLQPRLGLYMRPGLHATGRFRHARAHPAALLTNTVFYVPTKVCPTTNFLVKYTKKDTGNALDGDSAIELSPANYGKGEVVAAA